MVVALIRKTVTLNKPLTPEGTLHEDVTVSLLADLQQLQNTESTALQTALTDCDRVCILCLAEVGYDQLNS